MSSPFPRSSPLASGPGGRRVTGISIGMGTDTDTNTNRNIYCLLEFVRIRIGKELILILILIVVEIARTAAYGRPSHLRQGEAEGFKASTLQSGSS